MSGSDLLPDLILNSTCKCMKTVWKHCLIMLCHTCDVYNISGFINCEVTKGQLCDMGVSHSWWSTKHKSKRLNSMFNQLLLLSIFMIWPQICPEIEEESFMLVTHSHLTVPGQAWPWKQEDKKEFIRVEFASEFCTSFCGCRFRAPQQYMSPGFAWFPWEPCSNKAAEMAGSALSVCWNL